MGFSFIEEKDLIKVNRLMGMEGVGIYTILLRALCDNGGVISSDDLEDYAYHYKMDLNKVLDVVSLFFTRDDDMVSCERIIEKCKKEREISAKRSLAGALGQQKKSKSQANAEQMPSNCLTNVEQVLNNSEANDFGKEKEREQEKEEDQERGKELEEAKEKEKEKEKMLSPDPRSESVRDPIPYEKVKDMFNGICGGFFPRVTMMNDKRKLKLRARWSELSAFGEPREVLEGVFKKMIASDFMKQGSWASFDWAISNSTNWVKVYEGNYDNKEKKSNNEYSVNSIWK